MQNDLFLWFDVEWEDIQYEYINLPQSWAIMYPNESKLRLLDFVQNIKSSKVGMCFKICAHHLSKDIHK